MNNNVFTVEQLMFALQKLDPNKGIAIGAQGYTSDYSGIRISTTPSGNILLSDNCHYDMNELDELLTDGNITITSYFVQQFQGCYICGYRYYNGIRYVSVYVKSVYKHEYQFTLDYTHAKRFKYDTACAHRDYLMETIKPNKAN